VNTARTQCTHDMPLMRTVVVMAGNIGSEPLVPDRDFSESYVLNKGGQVAENAQIWVRSVWMRHSERAALRRQEHTLL